MTQQKRNTKRRRPRHHQDVFGPGALLWFSDAPEGHFRLPSSSGTVSESPSGKSLVRYGPDRAATPRALENRHHEELPVKQDSTAAYAAIVTITGQGHQISGGALIGCPAHVGNPTLAYVYVVQGQSYPVTGTPQTTWSVTVNGVTYSFPASDEGKSWTAQTMEVAVLTITNNGTRSEESPGYLVYWPVAIDGRGFIEPPTAGSNGVYFDVNNQPHSVEFRTTWSVPDFQTSFTWLTTDPFSGPYKCPKPHSGLGDGDTWASGDPTPGDGGKK